MMMVGLVLSVVKSTEAGKEIEALKARDVALRQIDAQQAKAVNESSVFVKRVLDNLHMRLYQLESEPVEVEKKGWFGNKSKKDK